MYFSHKLHYPLMFSLVFSLLPALLGYGGVTILLTSGGSTAFSGNSSLTEKLTQLAVFSGCWLVMFAIVHFTTGIRIAVKDARSFDWELTPCLIVRGTGKEAKKHIPCRDILKAEPDSYSQSWWKSFLMTDYTQTHPTVRLSGYSGPAVRIVYRARTLFDKEKREFTLLIPCKEADTLCHCLSRLAAQETA